MERTAPLSATEIRLWTIRGPQTTPWPSDARQPCRTGEQGEQEPDSEELEGIPDKQIAESPQPLSRDSSEPLQDGVGANGTRQRLLGSSRAARSPTAPRTPPAAQHLLFQGSSLALCSASKTRTRCGTAACPAQPPAPRVSGALAGKRFTRFAPQEAKQPHRLKNNLLSLIIIR